MTLTEEQRAALKRVIAYMNRMYGIASPYYGCTEDANILRAMIDSSDHIVEPDELIGFDLERARGLRDFLQDDCAEVGDVWGEMIAEIERLQASLIDLHEAEARIKELEADNQNLVTMNKALMKNDRILRDNNGKYRKRSQKAELLNKSLKSKIGPDAKPRSWQITDERKAAIGRAIESVVAADSDSEEQESEDVYTWRVLRDMLREAE